MLFPKIDTPPRYIDIFQKNIHIVPIQLLGLLRASLQRAKRWGAWKCWKRLLALPGEHILLLILFCNNLNCVTGRGGFTEWRRKYSSVRHRRPHRNNHLCGALLQNGGIQHLQGSRLSSEGIWNDAGSLTGFNFPKIKENDRPVPQAYLIIHNFCVTIVACALDLTFKFNWVLDAGSGKV